VRYEAVLRFSNSQGQPQADRKMDGRGMAIKLEGAAGENLLDGALSKAVASGDQDFVLANHPVFFGRDVPDYARFMMVLHRPRDTWRQQLLWWVRFILFFLLRPRLGLIFFRHSRKKVASPLTETYHSMAAYLLGEDSVVRYVATPVGAQLPTPDATSDDYLREALVAALDPLRPAPSGQSLPAFDFAIQVRAAPTPDDAEDASRAWDGPDDRVVPVARIVIGRQDVAAPAGPYACEGLSFNPWNAQPEHRPIGGLNRMRLAVYLASTQVRRRLNLTNAA
jgi:hypothetical protein